MKRSWTDADFGELSWHDNSVHGFRLVEGERGAGELILDLDYILEWLPSGKQYQFSVAPAELRFHEATDLRMSLDYAAATAAVTPFTLDSIHCDPTDSDGRSGRWTLKINWPVGEVSFLATGFTQTLTGETVVSPLQSLSQQQRVEYIATRDLTALHPSRGELALGIRIGRPYQNSADEWACPVALKELYSDLHDAHGVDSFQALMLARNLARTLLAAFVEDGGRLSTSPGGEAVDVQKLFDSGTL